MNDEELKEFNMNDEELKKNSYPAGENENSIDKENSVITEDPAITDTTEETVEKNQDGFQILDEDSVKPVENVSDLKDVKKEKEDEEDSLEDAEILSTEEKIKLEKERKKEQLDNFINVLSYIASGLLFLFVAGVTVYYILVASRGEFTSDFTDTILWAYESNVAGKLYNPDFKYACFLPFGTSLIMQPIVAIFGLSMTSQVIGMLCFFILLVVFLMLMLKEMHFGLRANLLAVTLFLSVTLSTVKMREIFWGHTIYYSLGILLLVIAMYMITRADNLQEGIISGLKDKKNVKTKRIHLIVTLSILIIFMILSSMNGISGIGVVALPFILALLAECFVSNYRISSKKVYIPIAYSFILGIAMILGVKINDLAKGNLVESYADANSNFSAMSEWQDHIHSFPFAWIKLLGVTDMAGTKISSKEGVQNLLYLMMALLFMVFPIIATCFYGKFKKGTSAKSLRRWIWIHWAVTGVILVGYICGILAAADWRIIPSIGTAIIVTVLFINWAVHQRQRTIGRITSLLIIPAIICGILSCSSVLKIKPNDYKESPLYQLDDFLEENGATYGYASFWRANAITVISGNKVKVRDVTIDENGVSPRIYQSSSEWYLDQPGQKNYFLLLDEGEYSTVSMARPDLINSCVSNQATNIAGVQYYLLMFNYNFMTAIAQN